MKRFFAVLGILGFAACGGNDEKNFEKVLSGNITISPTTACTDEELTADYSGTEKVNFQWNKDETAISGKIAQKFTPTEAGSYTVTVSLAGYNSKTSTAVTVTALLDLTGNITISPNTNVYGEVGTELTANYSGSETVNYQWNKDGTAIDGKTTQKFTPTEAGSYTVTVSLAGYKSKTSGAVVVPQTKSFNIDAEGNKTMTVKFMAVTDDDPIWWDVLVSALKSRVNSFTAGDHTLTVMTEGTATFAVGADGKAAVSEVYLRDATYDDIRSVVSGVMLVQWIAMMESNNAIHMANFRVPGTGKGVV
jgi:hypothetical protein